MIKQMIRIIIFIVTIEVYFGFQISNKCSSGQYFDTTLLECKNCPVNQVSSDDGMSCKCGINSYLSAKFNLTISSGNIQTPECLLCSNNSTSTLDRSRCISCPDGIDKATGECQCPEGYSIKEKNEAGQYLSIKSCQLCPDGTYPGPTGPVYQCKACPDGKVYDKNQNPWKCQCNLTSYITAGDLCVPLADSQLITTNYPVNVAKSLTFNNEETIDKNIDGAITVASSDTIDYLYLKSGYDCLKNSNSKSCQALANLCVLQMYDQNNPICKLYNYINNLRSSIPNSDLGKREGMPWLYYQSTADKVINDTQKIKFEVSFDSNDIVNVNRLKFYIATYDIEGNYLGMNLLTTELSLCTDSYEDGFEFRSFGSTIINRCNIDLTKYLERNHTMNFYELYLLDPTNNELVDIPIMIDNIPNPKASGIAGNLNNSTQPVDWILVRRFFLVDNLSALQGVNSYIDNNSKAFAIRFPRLLKLIVLLQNDPAAKIMVPYLEVFYKAKSAAFLKTEPYTLVMFISEYRMSIESFISAMIGIFITLNILTGIVVCIRMYIWYQLNPPTLSPDNYSLWFIWTGIFKLFQYWGVVMFWFTWGISAYWYVFFKLQYRVFLLLPPLGSWQENYKGFDVVFGIACSAYTLYICYKVSDQVNMDIFFIDWEHDKEILVKNATELRTEKYRGAWRVLQVANQFNELQKKRSISLSFCFLWLVFIWGYLKWDQNISVSPTTKYSPKSPDNYVLKHFLSTFILLLCGIGHLFVVRFFQVWIPLKKQEFIDLCCVANISVFILDQSLHGYYIHGQSPAGKADTNLDELLRFLEEEGSGRVRGRGLVEKDNEDLQSYEIYISYKMRTMYDGLYGLQSETMILSAQNRDKIANQSRIVNLLRHLPKSLQIDKIYKLKTYMNAELKEKIQKISSQPLKYVREKTNIQRFLDYPPLELVGDSADDIVFYKDPNINFDSCLISGIEWDWYLWNVFVFQMWQLTIGNLYLSVYLTWMCDWIMFKSRTFFGEKNLARKAIIDNKFFN